MPQAFFMMPKLEALENVREFLNIPGQRQFEPSVLLLWHSAGCTRLWPIRLWPSLFSRFGQFDFGQNKLFQLFARLRLKEICSTGTKILPSPHPPVFRGGQTQFMQGWSPEGWGPEEGWVPQMCMHISGPRRFKNTTNIPRKDLQEREGRKKIVAGEVSKKERNFGRSCEGAVLRRGGPGEEEGGPGEGRGVRIPHHHQHHHHHHHHHQAFDSNTRCLFLFV